MQKLQQDVAQLEKQLASELKGAHTPAKSPQQTSMTSLQSAMQKILLEMGNGHPHAQRAIHEAQQQMAVLFNGLTA
eukprot:1308299-Karenia_brevis.AAC.1